MNTWLNAGDRRNVQFSHLESKLTPVGYWNLPPEEQEEALELNRQVATGLRMTGADPTARIVSFSAEKIARRGVSSLENLFRKLPWSHASMTSQKNSSQVMNTLNSRTGGIFDSNSLGASAINLRGLG